MSRGPCYLWRLQTSFRWPPWQWHEEINGLLETFSLLLHVSGPTHLSSHTLDLIITRSSDDIDLASPKTTFPISDHFIIQCPIGFSRPALSCKKLTFRKLKNIDIAAFSADIASSMLCGSVHRGNIDALSDCFNKTPTDLLDKFAPLKTRSMINRPKVPWFNDDIKQLKRQRRRLEKRAAKTDLPISTLHFLNLHVWIIVQVTLASYFVWLILCVGNHFRRLFQSTLTPQSKQANLAPSSKKLKS